MLNIEDYIEALAGMSNYDFKLAQSDYSIINSFARQTAKSIPYTDRQFALAVSKVKEYAGQFEEKSISLENIESLRMPLRHIDRSKTVKIHDKFPAKEDTVYESWKDSYSWIEVRFPFSKKDILKIEQIKSSLGSHIYYHHEKGSHKHCFANIKNIAFLVTQVFSNFDIENTVKEIADNQKIILDNIKEYVPRVDSNGLHNVNDDLHDNFYNDIGKNATMLQQIDRAFRYNLQVETLPSGSSIADTIASRNEATVLIDPKNYTLDQIVEAIVKLDRFPLLVLVDDRDFFAETKQFYDAVKYVVGDAEQSILFRAEQNDKENYQLNQFIKDNNLNNWVDKTTKIVYIKNNKIPKVLFTSDFKPITAYKKSASRMHTVVNNFVDFYCDLIIKHDSQESLFTKYRRY